jgi:DNA-binding NarL/FixJ family response regulator
MRDTIASILIADGFDIVGRATDARTAVKLATRLQPDVCVLDINMPGGGIDAAATISAKVPDTVVVMLTVHVDDDHLFDALRAGARGYLVKGTSPEAMTAALRRALIGEPALSPGLAMRIVEQFAAAESRRVHVPSRGFVQLSPREAEVLDLMRQGLSTSVIAQRLFVSPVTVRTHISSVLKKLNATDRADALQMFDV